MYCGHVVKIQLVTFVCDTCHVITSIVTPHSQPVLVAFHFHPPPKHHFPRTLFRTYIEADFFRLTRTNACSGTIATTALMTTTHSPSLALPAELRLQIYELVLAETGPIEIPAGTRHPLPALLLARKQLHREGIEIYYKQNSFILVLLDNVAIGARLFTSLSTKYLLSVRGLRFELRYSEELYRMQLEIFRAYRSRRKPAPYLEEAGARVGAIEKNGRSLVKLLLDRGRALAGEDIDIAWAADQTHPKTRGSGGRTVKYLREDCGGTGVHSTGSSRDLITRASQLEVSDGLERKHRQSCPRHWAIRVFFHGSGVIC